MKPMMVVGLLLLGVLRFATPIAQECASSASARSSVRVEYDARTSVPGHVGAVVYARSDNGELTARDEESGEVLWGFRAPELAAAAAPTGLMTDLAVLRFDANGDGVIEASAGDRVWLYFGLERGGPYYYALDVSARTPRMLWKAGADSLEGLGDAWSTPTVARVRVARSAQNGEHFVLFIGGGFVRGSPATGNRIMMLDAATGRLLWSAGADADNDRVLAHMTHGIAARVAALDTDGDGFTDRLYTADTGGRVWRFDVWNGKGRDELVTGGMIASLGIAEPLPAPAASSSASARRFFNAPDATLMAPRGENAWYNLSIGSGDGDDVLSTVVRNRFYSLRDREPFAKRSEASYDSATPVFDADLTDITASPLGTRISDASPGWKLDLDGAVLAESLTANGVVLFTVYRPEAGVDGAGCDADGTNRVFAVKVDSGDAALDLNGDSQITQADRSAALRQRGIAVEPRIDLSIVPPRTPGTPATPGNPDAPGGSGNDFASTTARCFIGAELMNQCVPLDTVLRTYWKRMSVN
ncbi:MAG: hypothetical protein WDO56_36405 [Gammaproteobacteria bacterium]